MSLIDLAEGGYFPDFLVRIGIRRLLKTRLHQEEARGGREQSQRFAAEIRQSPLAVETAAANQQHYEVPAGFFELALGERLKYSCCLFDDGVNNLDEAERRMLQLTCDRAEIADGMEILELGCGWGSLTVWMAEQYPAARITAISNSHSQRLHIESICRERGLENVRVITVDMREFEIEQQFDRVISIEMFEHMRNYELLLQRISGWLKPSGKLFVHIFCHRQLSYLFETEGTSNWMGRHFFTGGMMPAEGLLGQFSKHLSVERQWAVNGLHYAETSEAWLRNLDANRQQVVELFKQDFDHRDAVVQTQRWRMFFMACAELFRFRGGDEWYVAHYLLRPAGVTAAKPACLVTSN